MKTFHQEVNLHDIVDLKNPFIPFRRNQEGICLLLKERKAICAKSKWQNLNIKHVPKEPKPIKTRLHHLLDCGVRHMEQRLLILVGHENNIVECIEYMRIPLSLSCITTDHVKHRMVPVPSNRMILLKGHFI